MTIKLEDYQFIKSDKEYALLSGRAKKTLIKLPEEWEKFVDLTTITVHLTQIGANQNLIVKRTQGLEVHLQSNGLPVDCYYLITGEILDKDS